MTAQIIEALLNRVLLSCSRESLALYLFAARALDGRVLRKNGVDRVVITPPSQVESNSVEADAPGQALAAAPLVEMPQVTRRQVEESQQNCFRKILCGSAAPLAGPPAIFAAFGTPDALWVGV